MAQVPRVLGQKQSFYTCIFLQYVMEDEHTKGPLHNNPEEAANYVKAVNLLLQSFVSDIRGFDHYKCLDAWETFLHNLSQLLSKLDSAYFTKMDTQVVLDTIPDKSCTAFLAHPEESSNVFPVTVYQQAPKLHPKCTYKKTSNVLITRDNELSPDYLATFKTHGRSSKSNRRCE